MLLPLILALVAVDVRTVIRQIGPPDHPLLLLTTHRRDAVEPARPLLEQGATALAPEGERPLLEDVETYWRDYRLKRFHDYAVMPTKVLIRPLPNLRYVRGGDVIHWHGQRIEVLSTPGFSPGAVSYLYDEAGRHVAVTGDLILGDGQLLDLYSLQDAIPVLKVRGYHGYAARAGLLIESLRRLRERKPDVLLPARGGPILNPLAAIDRLIARLQAVFRPYFQTDALRWYWGDDHLRFRARPVLGDALAPWMEMAAQLAPGQPPWYQILRTSRLIVSDSGHALLIDCGYREVIEEIQRQLQTGKIRQIDAIYVTHYHDDHTDFVQAAADAFQAPVLYDRHLEEICRRPSAFQMPALTSSPIHAGEALEDGHERQWREFRLTNFFFPGQTLYHGALLVERAGGERLLFAGDSFTPSGIDDYCLWNRNLLGDRQGYFLALSKLRALPSDTWIVNEHVDQPFRFSPAQLTMMEQALRERRKAIEALTVFDHANYAVDERWASFFHYAVEGAAGSVLKFTLRIDNPAAQPRQYQARLHLPPGWSGATAGQLKVGPFQRGELSFQVTPAQAGLFVLTADVAFGRHELPHWIELLADIR